MLRTVIDTNVFVRAIFHGDRDAQEVLRAASSGRFTVLATEKIQEEVLLALAGHAWFARSRPHEISNAIDKVQQLFRKAQVIEAPPVFSGCEDPTDNMFFNCAIAGRADFIVTAGIRLYVIRDPPPYLASPRLFISVVLPAGEAWTEAPAWPLYRRRHQRQPE